MALTLGARWNLRVGRRIGIIGGFVAEVPDAAVPRLPRLSEAHSFSPDRRLQMLHQLEGYDPTRDTGSMYVTSKVTDARKLWMRGLTGRGVDVAPMDTGVVPAEGLSDPGKVVNGPDRSFESRGPTISAPSTPSGTGRTSPVATPGPPRGASRTSRRTWRAPHVGAGHRDRFPASRQGICHRGRRGRRGARGRADIFGTAWDGKTRSGTTWSAALWG